MKSIPEEDFIDIRKVFYHLLSKWWYFLISLPICLGIALFYLKTTPETYEVQAKMQLKDQSLKDKGVGQEKFLSGLELLADNSELEDEIGILSSYNMIGKALERVDFNISLFRFPKKYGPLGRMMDDEIYYKNFKINLDESKPQILNIPIYISFPDENHYQVEAFADEATLFDLQSQSVLQDKLSVEVDRLVPIGEPYEGSFFSFSLNMDSTFVLPENEAYYFKVSSDEGLIKSYASKIDIKPIAEESNIVSLTLEGRVPAKEIAFLNALAEAYIENDLQKKNQLGQKAIEFIDKQLAGVKDSLKSAESSLKSFRAANNIMNVGTTSANLTEQLQMLEAERAQLSVKQEYYEYTAEHLRNEEFNDVVAPSSVGIQDAFLNNLLVDLSTLNQERIEKAYSSSDSNPAYRILNQKIRNTKATLIENIENLLNSNTIALQENNRRLNEIKGQLSRLPEDERNLKIIERRYDLNDNIYNYLLQKRAEAGLAIASNLPDKAIIDEARTSKPTPVSPNRKTTFMLAIIAALGLPIGLMWGQYFFKNKVTDKSDLQELSHVPMLGIIPRSPKNYKLPVAELPDSAISEAFRFLRIALDKQQAEDNLQVKGGRVISITSTQSGEGKTFCAANLAVSFARSRRKTLLIGGDLRNPRIHKYFNAKEYGVPAYLENDVSLESVLQPTILPHLALLGGGKPSADIEWLLESDKLSQLFAEALESYEIIIVDTPPVGLVADFYNMSRFFNQSLFVARHEVTDAQMFKGVVGKMTGLNKVSMVLNDAEGYVIKEYGHQYSNRSYYARPT